MSSADPHFPAHAPASAHLPAAVLRQYAAGTLTAAERRQVERHTLACPLCADALEGYLQAEPAAVSPTSLAELQQRLHARVAEPVRPRAGAWWMAAAAAILLLLVAVGAWWWPASRPVASREARQEVDRAATPATAPAPAQPAPEANAPAVAAAPPAVAAPAAPASVAQVKKASRQPTYAATSRRPRRARVARPTPPPADAAGADVAAAAVASVAQVQEAAPDTAAAPAIAAAPVPAPVAAKAARAAFAAESAAARTRADEAKQVEEEETAKRKASMPPAPSVAPMPVGGYPALQRYLFQKQQWPDEARSQGISGTVKLKFTVEADGSIQNIQVVRGLHPACDEEAVRLVCEGPAWRPGIVNGRRAAMPVRLDVPCH